MMTPFFNNFFPPSIFTFITDDSIDFTLQGDQDPFNEEQKRFFSENCPVPSVENIRQVHGVKVVEIEEHHEAVFPETDALMTRKRDMALAIRTADCLPVFIYDPTREGIALVHAGWQGSQKEVTVKAVEQLQARWGTDPSDLKVAFGPAIRSCCCAVGEEFLKFFPKEVIKKDEQLYLDLPAVNRNQLTRLGVREENVFESEICTCCNEYYFSYRRQGDQSGRMISLMMMTTSVIPAKAGIHH